MNKEPYGLTFKPICYQEEQQNIVAMEKVKIIINTMQIKNTFAAFSEVYENEIVIGPDAKVTKRDIYRSLYINGYNPNKINIIASNITYRRL